MPTNYIHSHDILLSPDLKVLDVLLDKVLFVCDHHPPSDCVQVRVVQLSRLL